MSSTLKIYYILSCTCLLFIGCKSEYEKLLETEMAKNIELKELPLELENGMTRKEFFSHCWDLNKRKIISQGTGNQYAQFELTPKGSTDTLQTVKMLFYGMFDSDEVMRGLDMVMEFYNWAPWNEDFQSDVLMTVLERHYMEEYGGNEFLEIDVMPNKKAKVKIDGDRRITMYPLSDQKVALKIVDLKYEDTIVKQ